MKNDVSVWPQSPRRFVVGTLFFFFYIVSSNSQKSVRFATFNVSLNRNEAGQLTTDLSVSNSSQPSAIAEIIQHVRPDVLLLNEFDYDATGETLRLFQENYLNVSQSNTTTPIFYPYTFLAPSNTGIPSGVDLNNDNATDGPNDAFGFGFFPGQYGMALLSQYPIDDEAVRTFQQFLWKDFRDPLLITLSDYYSDAAMDVLRLSSKSHWDVPILVDDSVIHVLASHPTPPVFDGPEDRNGKRNYDEIRFWAHYISDDAEHIYDDAGVYGGLAAPADETHFVILGDLNADPQDGDSVVGAADLLLSHPRVNTQLTPASAGGTAQALAQAGANVNHTGDPAWDTADFGFAGVGNPDAEPGNLRVDYVLPSVTLNMTGAGVFWPTDMLSLVSFPTSDHRLVYADVVVTPTSSARRRPSTLVLTILLGTVALGLGL